MSYLKGLHSRNKIIHAGLYSSRELLYVRPSTLANGFAPFEFAKALLEIETQINTMIETLI